jgi:hypothetical protein
MLPQKVEVSGDFRDYALDVGPADGKLRDASALNWALCAVTLLVTRQSQKQGYSPRKKSCRLTKTLSVE